MRRGRPKGTTRAKKPILKDEYNRLINAVHKTHVLKSATKPKFIKAFTLMYLTGCRVSEIIRFKTSDLVEMCERNEYSLRNNTKTSTPRLISFDSEGKQKEMIGELIPPVERYLFYSNARSNPMSISSFTIQLNNFIKRVLGEYYSTHSFRQGYITRGHQEGFSLEHLREDIGHKNLATTAIYTVVSSKEIADKKSQIDW